MQRLGATTVVDNESVEKICERIREDGEREVQSILEKARATASDIEAKAGEEGRKIAGKIIKDAEARGAVTQRRLLSSVNLEVRRTKLKAREEVVGAVNERLEKELGGLRGTDGYPEILARLAAEAIDSLEGDRFIVHSDRRDLPLLEETVFPALGAALEGMGRPGCGFEPKTLERPSLGGVQVGVPGGNVIYDNTFEARIYRLRDMIRNIIFEEAFSEQGGEEAGRA